MRLEPGLGDAADPLICFAPCVGPPAELTWSALATLGAGVVTLFVGWFVGMRDSERERPMSVSFRDGVIRF